jgi:Phosphoinositide phospholipase C, Ca2+-dependent
MMYAARASPSSSPSYRGAGRKLDDVRGEVLFFFDNGGPGAIRDSYLAGRPNLEGRAVFTRGPEGRPDAAVTMVNDPRDANSAEIQRLVRKGYFVRTRSDEPTSTVLNNETSRLGIALGSGAQMITTDFRWPGWRPAMTGTSLRTCPAPVRSGEPGGGTAEVRHSRKVTAHDAVTSPNDIDALTPV